MQYAPTVSVAPIALPEACSRHQFCTVHHARNMCLQVPVIGAAPVTMPEELWDEPRVTKIMGAMPVTVHACTINVKESHQ